MTDPEPQPNALPLSKRLHRWNRSVHRDVGYLCVGMTLVFATSGLILNHVASTAANFKTTRENLHMTTPLPRERAEQVAAVLTFLAWEGEVTTIADLPDQRYTIVTGNKWVTVEPATGDLLVETNENRRFTPLLHFLHLNEPGQLWTYLSDLYALGLLFLAVSGLFMIRGEKGIKGRGAVLALIGCLVPLLAWVLFY